KRIHFPVPGKLCARYVTRSEKRQARAYKKLWKFLLAYSKPLRAQRKQYELVTGRKAPKPTLKEREAWAKKAFAQIKGRGLGTSEMIVISDLFDEWWQGKWKFKQRQLVRLKGEKHQRASKNSKKAVKAKEEKMRRREEAALENAIAVFKEDCIKANRSLGFHRFSAIR